MLEVRSNAKVRAMKLGVSQFWTIEVNMQTTSRKVAVNPAFSESFYRVRRHAQLGNWLPGILIPSTMILTFISIAFGNSLNKSFSLEISRGWGFSIFRADNALLIIRKQYYINYCPKCDKVISHNDIFMETETVFQH